MNTAIQKSIYASLLVCFFSYSTMQAPLAPPPPPGVENAKKVEEEKKSSLVRTALKYGTIAAFIIAVAYSLPETRDLVDKAIAKFGLEGGVKFIINTLKFTGPGPEYIAGAINWIAQNSLYASMLSWGLGTSSFFTKKILPAPLQKLLDVAGYSLSTITSIIGPISSLGSIGKTIMQVGLKTELMYKVPSIVFTLIGGFLPYIQAKVGNYLPSFDELPELTAAEYTPEEIQKIESFIANKENSFCDKLVAVDDLLLNNTFEKAQFTPEEKQSLLEGHKAIFEITNKILGYFKDTQDVPSQEAENPALGGAEANPEEIEQLIKEMQAKGLSGGAK